MTFEQAMGLVNTVRATVARGFTINAYHDDRRVFDVTFTDGSPGTISTDMMGAWTVASDPLTAPNPPPGKFP